MLAVFFFLCWRAAREVCGVTDHARFAFGSVCACRFAGFVELGFALALWIWGWRLRGSFAEFMLFVFRATICFEGGCVGLDAFEAFCPIGLDCFTDGQADCACCFRLDAA